MKRLSDLDIVLFALFCTSFAIAMLCRITQFFGT